MSAAEERQRHTARVAPLQLVPRKMAVPHRVPGLARLGSNIYKFGHMGDHLSS